MEANFQKLIYVPGEWKCTKCRLRLHSRTISLSQGDVGVPKNYLEKRQKCSNGHGFMEPLTYKELCKSLDESIERIFKQKESIEAQNKKLVEWVAMAVKLYPTLAKTKEYELLKEEE